MWTLTCYQDHILTENIWFVWSETSYSGDERRCYRCGTNDQTISEDRATQPMEAGGWVSQLLQLVDTIPLHIPCLRCRILSCLPAISNLAPGVNKRLFACWLFHRWSPCFPFGKSNCCPSLPSTDVRSIGSKQGEETEQPKENHIEESSASWSLIFGE